MLARCASRLLDSQDPHEATELSRLFEGGAREVWQDELSKRLCDAATKFPHLAWRLCLQLVSSGNEWAEHVMQTSFPWRHIELRDFLNNIGGERTTLPNGFWDLFVEHIFFHTPRIWFAMSQRGDLLERIDRKPLLKSPKWSIENLMDMRCGLSTKTGKQLVIA